MRALVGLLALSTLAGCDTFFRIRGVLTDCDTRNPLPAGVVSSRMIRGAGEEDARERVSADGSYDLIYNEFPSASFEFTFSAAGYRSRTLVVDTTPDRGKVLEVCLEPERPTVTR